MKADPHSPASIFKGDVRYVVPLFQRPYVWQREEQWEPLWADVEVLANAVLSAPTGYGAQPVPPHFLGAVVLEAQQVPTGYILTRHVIDGQQRLTTLQLLLNAAQRVVTEHGTAQDAQALTVLVVNTSGMSQDPDDDFKVWPTDRDQAAFRAAMRGEVGPDLEAARIAQAHAFFLGRVLEWAEVETAPEQAPERLNALVRALRDHLRLVVIDLEPGDNAQVIFETLNHRGSPLLAADLVKNFLFQVAQAQGADVRKLYDEHWKVLDGDVWREPVAQGRRYRPRIDVFLTYWLTMKTLAEVPGDHVFPAFRDHMRTQQPAVPDTIRELVRDASVYQQMEALPADSVEGTFHYRVLRAMDTASVGPFLLWLLRWPEQELPVEQRHKALRALESWVVRRALCRLTGKGTNLVVLELLRTVARQGPGTAGDTTESFLAEQTADARLWPDDAAVRASLASTPLYTAITRPRLRMLLEALEDDLRSGYGEGERCPHGLSVEHVMPQGWREHWHDGVDEAEAARRDRRVHRLGNLTLVTGRLNSALSHRPWTNLAAEAAGLQGGGKRAWLLEHSSLKLTAKLVAEHEDAWTDDDVRSRTSALADRVVALWPRPASAAPVAVPPPVEVAVVEPDVGPVPEAEPEAGEADLDASGLQRWLLGQDRDDARLLFEQVERLLGCALPASARTDTGSWATGALGGAVGQAGWVVAAVDLDQGRVELRRATTG